MRSALGRSPLAGDRRDGLGLSVARKRAPTGPGAAMSSLPTAPSSSSERRADQNPCARPWVGARLRATVAMASGSPSPASGLPTGPGAAMSSLPTAPSSSSERRADQNPCARPWVGARLRATVAMASGSPSPASGLLPVPARQCHLCRQHQAHRAKDVHTNPCARPWVGARLWATVAMASGFSVARKRAPTGPSAAMSSLPTSPSSSIERRAHQPMRSALGRSPLAGDRCDSWCSTVSLTQSRSGRAGRVAPS
jgi:hypothetical protein